MNTIKALVNKYLGFGFSIADSRTLAAEEIILTKIATSNLAKHVTLKGGIVMFGLTNNSRRITQDIDFDLIRYSIDKESLKLFIKKLNNINDGFKLLINGDIESLHQQDYQGARIKIIIEDHNKQQLRFKLDVGVHTYYAIEQKEIAFCFEENGKTLNVKANPPEQIFSEKLISLARFGIASTRYKDIYDLYYLIDKKLVSTNRINSYLQLFFDNSSKMPNNLNDFLNVIEETLNNSDFEKEASKPVFRWLDTPYAEIKKVIINFLRKL